MKKYQSKTILFKELKEKKYFQIAKENKVSVSTIQRYMRAYRLTKKIGFWTKREIRILKKEYVINPNIYNLLQKKSINSINHKASRLGLKKKIRKGIYTTNQNFFKKWSNKMAYVLGWFFSDGCVHSDRRHASIHTNRKDHYILERINKIMGSNRPVKIYSGSSYLRIHNCIIAKDLINLGCIPKKSLTLEFPTVKDKFLSNFVRGYFDGDGSIHFNKPNTIKISFIGTKKFLECLRQRLNKILKVKQHPITRVGNVYRLYYYGDDSRNICNWMYKNVKNLYLKRKKERFKKHLSLRKKKWSTNK